jgi:heme exporter protein D
MLDFFEFILSGFWTWLGFVIILAIVMDFTSKVKQILIKIIFDIKAKAAKHDAEERLRRAKEKVQQLKDVKQ